MIRNPIPFAIPALLASGMLGMQELQAAYVLPAIGGGQVGMMGAPMKHADITLVGNAIEVHIDDTVDTPVLRPLIPPDAFDPARPWSVLIGKAYNYQYAWNPGGFITLPPGGAIWVERLHHDPGLQTFLRPPQWTGGSVWTEIFTHDGYRWKWAGAMQHNAYAVTDPPARSTYMARYRVFIGDAQTGEPWLDYTPAEVTWTWYAVPEPASAVLLALAASRLRRRVSFNR